MEGGGRGGGGEGGRGREGEQERGSEKKAQVKRSPTADHHIPTSLHLTINTSVFQDTQSS